MSTMHTRSAAAYAVHGYIYGGDRLVVELHGKWDIDGLVSIIIVDAAVTDLNRSGRQDGGRGLALGLADGSRHRAGSLTAL